MKLKLVVLCSIVLSMFSTFQAQAQQVIYVTGSPVVYYHPSYVVAQQVASEPECWTENETRSKSRGNGGSPAGAIIGGIVGGLIGGGIGAGVGATAAAGAGIVAGAMAGDRIGNPHMFNETVSVTRCK